jgi:hypothetical protein
MAHPAEVWIRRERGEIPRWPRTLKILTRLRASAILNSPFRL